MLRAIFSQESRESALEKAASVVTRLKDMKLQRAAKTLEQGIGETLSYYGFLAAHWRKIRTNNALERLNREIRRRTNVVGSFPESEAALMLVAAILRYVLSHQWGTKRYMNTACPERVWSRCWKERLNPPYRTKRILWVSYSRTDFQGAIV